MSGQARSAWNEGYATCAADLGMPIRPENTSPNPYDAPPAVDRLTIHERRELRAALGFHFETHCLADWDDQALIIEAVVGRILSRRPTRGGAA